MHLDGFEFTEMRQLAFPMGAKALSTIRSIHLTNLTYSSFEVKARKRPSRLLGGGGGHSTGLIGTYINFRETPLNANDAALVIMSKLLIDI